MFAILTLLQILHLYLFSPVCRPSWSLYAIFDENDFLQNSQNQPRFSSETETFLHVKTFSLYISERVRYLYFGRLAFLLGFDSSFIVAFRNFSFFEIAAFACSIVECTGMWFLSPSTNFQRLKSKVEKLLNR